jgi:hypothetical protein
MAWHGMAWHAVASSMGGRKIKDEDLIKDIDELRKTLEEAMMLLRSAALGCRHRLRAVCCLARSVPIRC